MNLRQNESTRTVQAPAKLNLFLDILDRREDGFHELETLVVPVRLFDSISFTPSPADGDGQPGPIGLRVRAVQPVGQPANAEYPMPRGAENLIVQALELLRKRSGCPVGAKVELVKRIPIAAGLGGGSSDAAAALRLGNAGWRLGWSHERLIEFAAELGSDVPLFLGSGAAICRGRGERVEQVHGIRPLDVVIVKPPEGLDTKSVYEAHAALADQRANDQRGRNDRSQLETLVARLRRAANTGLGHLMVNRLQAAAASLSPWIGRVQATFAKLDVLAHQLSGSGTAYFGICRHAQNARRVATILRTENLGHVYATRTCY